MADLIAAPAAKKMVQNSITHGINRIDAYAWLRERENPEVMDYLNTENRFCESVMGHTQPLQETLYKEMVSRIKETDDSVPVKWGGNYYYSRTEKDRQYKIFCRKQGSLDAPEEILLDANVLAKGKEYFSLGIYRISPDHRLLSYSVDTNGSEKYVLYIKDLVSGQGLSEAIPDTYYGMEWGNDNRTIYYNTVDAALRPYRLFRHILGNDHGRDELIYEEKDERYFLELTKSRSDKYIFMHLGSKVSSEVRYLDAGKPSDDFKVFQEREKEVEYAVEHHEGDFLIVTNERAVNFKLMKTAVAATGKSYWEEVIPHRNDVLIEGVDAFKDFLVIYERSEGLKRIRIRNMSTHEDHDVNFPDPVYTVSPGGNPEYDSVTLRFVYTSMVVPSSTYDYDMNTRTRELKKQEEVIGYDPSAYSSERVFAAADDGSRIPISLVYKKGMTKSGNNPLLLYGYGSYGITVEPGFSSPRVSLLDRGFIFAIAHIRGGQEMGRRWYEDGKLMKKKNTFTDFIRCAEFLIGERYTSSKRMAIMGASAGGLLMGTVANMRPDLFNAVVAKVPFVDVVNTMLDASLPLTVTEYEEWGDPNQKEYYEYIRSYAPYENVEKKNYPNILATAGLNDPRVSYWEPAKWVAKLRDLKTDGNLLLLKTNMGAGHGGASGRYDYLKEIAFEYAFIIDRVG